MALIRPFRGVTPKIDPTAFVAENATVVGDVVVGPRSSLWFGCVLRGDVFHIRIGAETSIQDNTVIHVTHGAYGTTVGDRVTVGHSVTLHGCTIGNRVLVGIGAIVMDGCEVGDDCMIAAGSLLSPGTKIPPGHLALGSPATVKRPLRPEELTHLRRSAENYALLAARYRELGIA